MFVGSNYNLINKVCKQPVLINNTSVSRTNTQKCLGVEIDEKRSWEKHIDTICKKTSVGIGAMRHMKAFVPINTLKTVYKALVQPYFDYCSPLWDTVIVENSLKRYTTKIPISCC